MLDITDRLLCYQTVIVGEPTRDGEEELPGLYLLYAKDGSIVDVIAESGKYLPTAVKNLVELELVEITRSEYDVLRGSRHSGEYAALGWDEPEPPPNKNQMKLPYE